MSIISKPRYFLLTAFVCSLLQANLLVNSDFEAGTDKRFEHWEACHFGTHGSCLIGEAGDALSGKRFARLRSEDDTQRSAWRQRVTLPENTSAVTVEAHYRTRNTQKTPHRGASFRLHWFNAQGKEIGLVQRFFPPSETWCDTGKHLFMPPKDARFAQVQLFHWLTPGETHWDNAKLNVITMNNLDQLDPQTLQKLTGLDQQPVDNRSLPYHPADGDVVSVNPPPFRWIPAGQDRQYTLQICRQPDYAGDTLITRSSLPWAVEILDFPLAAGDWHWRVGYVHPHLGQVWSRSRRFTIPEGVRQWPFPKDLPRLQATTPRLFFSPEQQARLRQRTQPNGDLHAFASSLLQQLPSWQQEQLVAEPDWLPQGKDRGRVYTEVFRRTRPPMDRMERTALTYLLTGDELSGQEAKRRVLHFFSWDANGPTNTFHNDEPAMWIMMRGCRAYDWTRNLYTAEERQKIEACMVTRAKAIYDLLRRRGFENNPFESHLGRQIGFLGEACLTLLPEHPEVKPWLEYILKIYWGVYPAWGKDDGGWNEGPHYWSYYMEFALHFIVALSNATGIELIRKPFFAATPYHFLYLCPPQSTISPFGDGTQAKPLSLARLISIFGRLLDDPYLLWYAQQHNYNYHTGTSLLELALPACTSEPQSPDHLLPARHFPGVGLVASHTGINAGKDNVTFLFRSSPYGAVSHGHNDQNCFALSAYGEPLAIPTGHYNYYGSAHHDKWTRHTKAKCGITYDNGTGQFRGPAAKGRITDFVQTPQALTFTGDATAAYGGNLTEAVRQVVRIMPDLFVIRDTLASDKPRTFEYWLHATHEMTLTPEARTVVIKRPQARLTTTFLAPQTLSFAQNSTFDPPPTELPSPNYVDQFHFTATSAPVKECTFISVLFPQRTSDNTPLPKLELSETETAQLVTIRHHDGAQTLVAFNKTPGQNTTIGQLQFNAAINVLQLDARGRATNLLQAP